MEERQGLMRAFRQVLLARGFQFCDEGEPEPPFFPLPTLEVQQETEPLIIEGVEASSTDAPQQSIGCTLDDDGDSFWSSTGSQSPEACEYLLYKLKSPLCLLRNVQMVVFRAHYQFGEPIYPPAFVSFQAGPAPWSLAPPSLKFPVAASEAVQCFPLPADLPLGRYLRINLHGKRQRQLEDMQWYHAIQRVEAFGHVLPPSAVVRLRASIVRQPLPAAAAGAVPGYIAAEALWQPGAAGQADGEQQEQEQQEAEQQERQQEGQQAIETEQQQLQPQEEQPVGQLQQQAGQLGGEPPMVEGQMQQAGSGEGQRFELI